MKTEFLSTVTGYIFPIGSHQDPSGKEGLFDAAIKSYSFGTKQYPESNRLFTQLERTGAVFLASGSFGSGSLMISVPNEKLDEASGLLDEIFLNVLTSTASLEKIKESMQMEQLAIRSEDEECALTELLEMILQERAYLGSDQSRSSINIEDLSSHQKTLLKNSHKVLFRSAENFILPDELKSQTASDNFIKSDKRTQFIEKELSQSVVCLGYRMKGYAQYSYAVRRIAAGLLSGGLVGFLPEIIREEKSAAYYAYAASDMLRDKGIFYISSGVSAQNAPLVIETAFQILERVAEGNFEDERMVMAKAHTKRNLDQTFDNISGIAGFYSTLKLLGGEIRGYDQILSEIQAVTKDEIQSFFNEVFIQNEPYLVVNGKLPDEVKVKCENLINNHD